MTRIETTAKAAVDHLDAHQWAATPIETRLNLLYQVRENLKIHGAELAKSDLAMKNGLLNEELFRADESLVATVVPVGNTLTACISLYESIQSGKMPEGLEVKKVGDNLYDVRVFPHEAKDKVMYADRKDYLRVKGKPQQTNPMDKPASIIAVLGAGNYSSALEMVKAIFLENAVVVHKPHHLNEQTDKIWAKIFQPLINAKAISFCQSDQGRALTQDERLSKIYFTGGASTAQAITAATKTELVSECGGNNPCIVVPGVKSWSKKEIEHQAVQIVTMSKLNGGAVCGRPQTLITCKNWEQREEFLEAIRNAIKHETPAAGSYYPGSKDVVNKFLENHPNAEIIQPENGAYKHSDHLFIPSVNEKGYAVKNEAFCQILSEVPLDTPANADVFLEKAVHFANTELLGTLGSCIIIDDATQKKYPSALDQAVTDMKYGGIAVNTMPPFIFLNPYLTWGGNEEGDEIVSGRGHFGNLLCYENIEKSIIYADFMSMGHMMNTNKSAIDSLSRGMAKYAIDPSWMNLTKLTVNALSGKCKSKDF